MSGGSPEQALLSAASAQMSRFYDLTGGTASGMSDAKLPDMQAGYEKAYNHALVGNAGANLIYESAGMLASLLGFSMEGLIIDNDVIGAVQRTIKGIDVSDESLSLETIRKVCLEGPGHYLGSDQTLQLMQKEYIYPSVGDRTSPNEWVEQGRPSVVERASRKLEAILASHYPSHIPESVDCGDPRAPADPAAAFRDASGRRGLAGRRPGDRRQNAGEDLPGIRRASGNRHIDRDHVGNAAAARVAFAENAAGAAAVADGDHELRIGRRIVGAPHRNLHVLRDRSGDQQQIRVTRARHESDAELFDVVERIIERVNLQLAAVAGSGIDGPDAKRAAEHLQGCAIAAPRRCAGPRRSPAAVR